MTTTVETKRPTHCPTCGVKLPDIPVSLCAYCASPVDMGTKAHGGSESPNASRIAKISAHKTFEEVQTYVPPESPRYLEGMRKMWHGRNLALLGIVVAGLGFFLGTGGLRSPWFWLGLIGAGFGAWMWARGIDTRNRAVQEPLTARPGMIVDRRSETAIRHWNGETVYYFSIEFDGGAVGEYRFEGRGASEDPYPTGMTGIAFLRGPELLEFKQIRV